MITALNISQSYSGIIAAHVIIPVLYHVKTDNIYMQNNNTNICRYVYVNQPYVLLILYCIVLSFAGKCIHHWALP